MMPQRPLGQRTVSAIGYGAMVLEGYYGSADETAAVSTLRHALDIGMNFIDTADAYGNGHNEELLARALSGRRNVVIATKFGIVFSPNERGTQMPTGWGFPLKINGTQGYALRCLEGSLKRLGVETIDLWYLHYADPAVPVEETVGAMATAVQAGKVRQIGLSNVTPEQVRKAHAVHPIAAVQFEYSLWRREAERSLIPTLRELGIALVAWGPLGSGFLTGTLAKLPKGDFRQHNPKFAGDNFKKNANNFAALHGVARKLGITPAQLALAWLLHQGPDIIPIPGTRKLERIDENAGAAAVTLDAATLRQIDMLAPPGLAAGANLVP